MSLQTHLNQLSQKHEALEREIQEAIQRPAENDLRIAELKRRKLYLKDEIRRLQDGAGTIH
ncbi:MULTISPECIES: DUF465 domain-containing protein [Methylobacterium]|uniref:DUF465 domain-containing protein n=1 Tax=Methylobacterium jeotgali TaxID=381630 RepID=A0ABQ4SVM2_9HYPH|nr:MULTISPECIES: DUF465 domain-containing protein [Methylobacterium]PIU04142.1 MAG: DUF465 domain-containing protein [Methylobacterium sp. CG09_land_8_20_14_0_10_71_15]PIU15029.1 MAG: DUF465 domain-containing protein [Methylobacterium sp. CG08_land_8_20_14_0_20_71_15]GBU17837.1 hypothetical protein AwMethylo_20520 [Methylobacterium sp.]GJE07259.1 hypothetical protein AOPFMNJM_2585 [Methylobacterium jeotgali]